jgi:hypothetical protein
MVLPVNHGVDRVVDEISKDEISNDEISYGEISYGEISGRKKGYISPYCIFN